MFQLKSILFHPVNIPNYAFIIRGWDIYSCSHVGEMASCFLARIFHLIV